MTSRKQMVHSSSDKSRRVIWGTTDQSASLQSMEKKKSYSESSGNRPLGTMKEGKVAGNSQHGFNQDKACLTHPIAMCSIK